MKAKSQRPPTRVAQERGTGAGGRRPLARGKLSWCHNPRLQGARPRGGWVNAVAAHQPPPQAPMSGSGSHSARSPRSASLGLSPKAPELSPNPKPQNRVPVWAGSPGSSAGPAACAALRVPTSYPSLRGSHEGLEGVSSPFLSEGGRSFWKGPGERPAVLSWERPR